MELAILISVICIAASVAFILLAPFIGDTNINVDVEDEDFQQGIRKRKWNIYSGTVSATVNADTRENAVTNFLVTISHMPNVALADQIGIYESGTSIEDAAFLMTALEVGRRHLVHNKVLYNYINERQLTIDDDWYNVLKANAAHYKAARHKGVVGTATITFDEGDNESDSEQEGDC